MIPICQLSFANAANLKTSETEAWINEKFPGKAKFIQTDVSDEAVIRVFHVYKIAIPMFSILVSNL